MYSFNYMPNDCWNNITVISLDQDELITLIHNEFMYKDDKDKLLFHKHIELLERGERGIKINCWSAWKPDFDWLSKMIHNYKSCWIKNRWNVEDGLNGIWIGEMREDGPNIINYNWEELSIDAEYFHFKSSDNP
jgi:hypothetical protein